jgi:hypothetical protein
MEKTDKKNSKNEIKLPIDLIKAYEGTRKDIEKSLSEASKIWFGVIKLVITLSTSILLLSVALIDRLFPIRNAGNEKYYLFISWLLLFITILFCIISELQGAWFFKKMAKIRAPLMKTYMRSMQKGQFVIMQEDLERKYIEDLPLSCGIISLIMFLLSVVCLFVYFAKNVL